MKGCTTNMRVILFGMHDNRMVQSPQEVALLLQRAATGDMSAANEALRTIERELRRIASIHMRRERAKHTLQTSAVMNEAVIRLLGSGARSWNSRQHFLAVASRVMRRLLVDYARRPRPTMISLDLAVVPVAPVAAQVLDVHKALTEFESIAPR